MNKDFSMIPAVHKLLDEEKFKILLTKYSQQTVVESINDTLNDIRKLWSQDVDQEYWKKLIDFDSIFDRTNQKIINKFSPKLREVLNLTGVVLHTNLGRAPLSKRAIEAVNNVAENYINLEYDLNVGERGSRYSHIEHIICKLTEAEAACVVNNNAAAVLLVLNELGNNGEGIVSRGQLVEIGGSFRIPDIMESSGVTLKEVGTTNKTKLIDYERAINEQTRLLLRVHTSNFKIVGFTEQPDLYALADLAHNYELPLVEDLGSGAIFNFSKQKIGNDPTVIESIRAGVDIVTFSGDKLLGGAQAGIIVGKKHFIDRIKKNPLMRALRVDKMTLAALEVTLIDYQDEKTAKNIPVIRMITENLESIYDRAIHVIKQLDLKNIQVMLDKGVSKVGGGSLPAEEIETHVIKLTSQSISSQQLYDDLHTIPTVPVIGRIFNNEVLLDIRTLLPHQISKLVTSLTELDYAYSIK